MTPRRQDRPLSARLAALSEAVPAAKQRERECEMAHRRAEADVAQLRDAVIDAHSEADEARAKKASRERDTAESTTLRDAAERLAGTTRAVARAEAQRGLFAVENVDGLLQERSPDARAVATAAEDAIEELGRAHAAWSAMEAEVLALLRLAGRDTGNVPRFPYQLEQLVRDARRAGTVDVPPPLPAGSTYVAVVPYDDTNPEIREPARAKIKRNTGVDVARS